MHVSTLALPVLLLLSHPDSTTAQSYSFQPACTTATRTRYEWRELSSTQQKAYIDAVLCLKKAPSKLKTNGSPSLYDDFVYVHWKAQNAAHGNAAFPPWHRVFLTAFEDALGTQCKYSGALPYWDWSVDSQAPEKAPIWKSFGGDGKNGRIADGPFAGWQATFPSKHYVNRNFKTAAKVGKGTDGNMMAAHYSPAEIQFILNRKTYNDFRSSLESHPHNQVHNNIGGDMGNPMLSSNDPIFWLHHCNIDRLWAKWQATHPSVAKTYGGPRLPGGSGNDARDTDDLTYSGFLRTWKVKDTYDTKALCYTYSNSVKPPTITDKTLLQTFAKRDGQQQYAGGSPSNPYTPDPYDRTDMFNIRYHEPLDDDFLRSMNYPDWLIAQIHKEEKHIRMFIDFVNAVDGYVSKSALCNYNATSREPEYVSQNDAEAELEENVLNMLVDLAVGIIGEFGKQIYESVTGLFEEMGVDYKGWWGKVGGGGSYQQQQPGYEQPSYQQPSYQQPSYQTPSYQTPTYQTPSYSYEQPSYQAPSYDYQQPSYQAPSYEQQPSYDYSYEEPQYQQPYRPSYNQDYQDYQPSYQQPSYQQPSYQTPAYQVPSYDQSYQAPSYEKSYQTPSYGTKTYEKSYQTPSYGTKTYEKSYQTPDYQQPSSQTPSYNVYQAPSYQAPPQGYQPQGYQPQDTVPTSTLYSNTEGPTHQGSSPTATATAGSSTGAGSSTATTTMSSGSATSTTTGSASISTGTATSSPSASASPNVAAAGEGGSAIVEGVKKYYAGSS
ncbi:hypothetical protein HDV00_007513 [Rhizophlyctis rosea]|nr:hypothetical protein HDV00_007513 [Rhizophlyctis rosea]